jgi:hypothetical protein
MEVKVPQEPLKSCKYGFVKLLPCPLSTIVSLVEPATNEYQTSLYVPTAAQPVGMLLLGVAPAAVPAVTAQLEPGVRTTAPLQSSFSGGTVFETQTEKPYFPEFPLVDVVVNTLK